MLKQSVWTFAVVGLVTACWIQPALAISPAEAKIRSALSEDTEVQFIETPLVTVVEYLQDLHAIPIVIDGRSLDTLGIAGDTPVTRDLKGISLRAALNITLHDLELTWMIRDEVLVITSVEAAEKRATARVFDITPLLKGVEDASAVAEQIQAAVGENPARDGKEPHAKKRYLVIGNKLIVRAPTPEQERVETLLEALSGEHHEEASKPVVRDAPTVKPRRKPMPEGVPADDDPFGDSSGNDDPFGGAPGTGGPDPFGGADPFAP